MSEFLENSLIIAIVGTATVLLGTAERLISARDEGRTRVRIVIMYSIVLFTMIMNITLYWYQYNNVTTIAARERKGFEREFASSLWAYTKNEKVGLKYLAQSSKYMLGYYYFQQQPPEYALARRALNESISKGSFIAPSRYILAVMARLEGNRNEARRQLDASMAYDPDYASAYQERGLLYAIQGQRLLAVSDIKRAVDLSSINCYTVLRSSTKPDHPAYLLRNEPEFIKLKEDCKEIEREGL